MELFVTALNSGSNGNCYYIGNEEEAVLVDVGISCREVELRLKRLQLPIDRVKAIFISHEHSDHCRGIRVLSKKYKLPVYITKGTLLRTNLHPENPFIVKLATLQPVAIGKLKVIAFPKFHDANDPQSFVVTYNGVCVGVFTDIGMPCQHVIQHFKSCHAVFLETNYDSHMLATGNYPFHLKRRIDGEKGHLSNQQALDLFVQYKPQFMSHVFLSHISKENNDLGLVYELFKSHAGNVEVVLTSRTCETAVYSISSRKIDQVPRAVYNETLPYIGNEGKQLSLAF